MLRLGSAQRGAHELRAPPLIVGATLLRVCSMCLLGSSVGEQWIPGAPHEPGAADVLREIPLAIEGDVLGLTGELDALDVAQFRLRADTLDQKPAEATMAILRCDDNVEHECNIHAVREHPGERDQGFRPLLTD